MCGCDGLVLVVCTECMCVYVYVYRTPANTCTLPLHMSYNTMEMLTTKSHLKS